MISSQCWACFSAIIALFGCQVVDESDHVIKALDGCSGVTGLKSLSELAFSILEDSLSSWFLLHAVKKHLLVEATNVGTKEEASSELSTHLVVVLLFGINLSRLHTHVDHPAIFKEKCTSNSKLSANCLIVLLLPCLK